MRARSTTTTSALPSSIRANEAATRDKNAKRAIAAFNGAAKRNTASDRAFMALDA